MMTTEQGLAGTIRRLWRSVAVRITLIDVLLICAVVGAAYISTGVLRETEQAIQSSLEEFSVESGQVHRLNGELDTVITALSPAPGSGSADTSDKLELADAESRISVAVARLSETLFKEADERARIVRIRDAWATATPLTRSKQTRAALSEMDAEIDALMVSVEAHVTAHLQDAAGVNQRALKTIPPLVILVIVLYVILRTWISSWIQRSADALHAGMASMAEGDLSTRIPAPAVTEFRRTAETLNHMAERLGRNQRLLTEVSVHDELTGLFNRREFERRLAQEIQRGRRYAHAVSLLMIDIDDFKRFNDTYGHMLGDRALCEVAAQLAQTIRPADLVARWGGEEFVILLPETPPEAAAAAAQRALESVWGARVFNGDLRLPVTVSVGVATYPIDVASARELLAAADDALYAAKKGGKNRLVQQGIGGLSGAVAS